MTDGVSGDRCQYIYIDKERIEKTNQLHIGGGNDGDDHRSLLLDSFQSGPCCGSVAGVALDSCHSSLYWS